jgi:hypothetical protein
MCNAFKTGGAERPSPRTMNRRQFLAASGVAAALLPLAPLRASAGTQWIVGGSEGFDAISFLGPLSGDPFYSRYYEAEIAAFAPRLPPGVLDEIRALKAISEESRFLLAPLLNLILSGGPHHGVAALIDSIDHAEAVLRPPYAASTYWSPYRWDGFIALAPRLRGVLVGLSEAGFPAYWAELVGGPLEARLAGLRPKLAAFDVIPELERYTGRRFDPAIEIALLHFCKPHGIRVQGQRFLSAIDWSDDIVIRTAGHELLHPPVDMGGPAARAALAVLEQDPLLRRIVEEHDPAFGYNSLPSLFDEDLASAIDQIVGARLGVARDPAERWTQVDGGMHVLSAGLYGLMHSTGFARAGGDLERWLHAMAIGGWLDPIPLHGAAAAVLRRPVEALWPPPPAAG